MARSAVKTVPTDAEILALDTVPVSTAARYLGWTEQAVRFALRESRAPFGICFPADGQMVFKISPGGLVRYKREGVPCIGWKELRSLIEAASEAGAALALLNAHRSNDVGGNENVEDSD